MTTVQTLVIFANTDADMVARGVLVEHDINLSWQDITDRMRHAVKNFLAETETGKNLAEDNGGDFNWGDAVIHVPDDFWEAQGLKMVEISGGDDPIVLDHDENLCEEE
jgi:hypothetical protein